VVGMDKEVDIIGIFGDVSDVVIDIFDVYVVKGLNMIGWGIINVDEVVCIVEVDVEVVKLVGTKKSGEGGIGIDSKDGIMGKGGMDVGKVVKSNEGDVVTNGLYMIGNKVNARVISGVKVGGNGCFINIPRGKNDMFTNGVDVLGVDVWISFFDVDVGEGIDGKDVGIGVYINESEIGAKDEYDVIDWGMIKVDEVDDIVKVN
ncbi:hypothetical protein KI387_007294, partial [Taxus chinensis]